MSFIGSKALWMVINFLVFWIISLSSFLAPFKNGPEYLTTGTVLIFIPLLRFLLQSLVSSSFLVLLRYYFLHFPFISDGSMVFASGIPKYLLFSVSPTILILSWFDHSIHPLFLFSISHYEPGTFFDAKFHSYILFVYPYGLYRDR